jgi:glycerol-3-phosphate dehydrogenase
MRLSELDGLFDAAIVGGGIIGSGIARDAARRGLRVALVEKADFGGGTTAGSTRLIHGGLRYLERLDLPLVRLDLRERETLLRIAPHRVTPLPFLLPCYGRSLFYRAKLRAGMLLYDALSFDKSLPNHRFLSADETLRAEPGLIPRGLAGAALYWDAQVDSPELLTLDNIADATACGAVTLNYVEALEALAAGAELRGLRVRDTLTGDQRELRARIVVNASGPWFDRVAARLAPHPAPRIRTTKGVHLACDHPPRHAVVLFSKIDGRLMFVIPWLGYAWIGTTDTDFAGDPAAAAATGQDIDYLLRSAAGFMPSLGLAHVHWTSAGIRALVTRSGSESAVSRLHKIEQPRPGLISVLGGKITGYRAIAAEVTDLLSARLGLNKPSTTAELPLPRPPDFPSLEARVTHSVRHQRCLRVEDFMLRRSLLGFRPDRGAQAFEQVARLMGQELKWSEAERLAETQSYREKCDGTRVSLSDY